jgi:LysR family transcriptional regulator, carnitine catabolism transcriptional activator
MNITLRQLQAFCTVARLGSFTKAALALHTTQPALSVQISQLEDSLHLRLFDRTTRAVAITSVGRELLPRAERTLAELSGMIDSATGLGDKSVGRVVVAALPSVASSFMPEAIAAFRKMHPGIDIVLRDGLGGQIAELMRTGEVDFGITGEGAGDAELHFTVLGSDEMVAVAPEDHPLGKVKRITLEALVEYPLILMSRDSSVRRLVDHAFAERGHLPIPVQEPVYMSTAIAMVRAGLGVALLPSSASELRAAHDVRCHHIAHRGMSRHIGIVLRRGRSPSPAAEEFERFLRTFARKWF